MRLDPDDLDGLLAWTAVRAGRRMQRLVSEALAEHHVTPIQFGVLAHLGLGRPMTQTAIAHAVQIRPQSAREAITVMAERGLVERLGPGGRGRRAEIALSTSGSELLSRTWPLVHGLNAPAALGLGPGEDETLLRLLHAVLRGTEDRR